MMAERRVHFINAVEEANAQPDPQLTPRLPSNLIPFASKSSKNGSSATMATGGVKDALPVVEIKPFFNQVWRREKSLPDFYAKAASAKTQATPLPNPPRHTIQSEPSPDVVTMYRDGTSLLWKDVSPRVQFERSEVNTRNGARTRAHPPMEYSYNCVPKRSGGYIPEFIPRQGRAKSTMEETRRDDSVTRLYSCVKHALTTEMMARQQEIRVEGGRMRQSLQRRQLLYLNPLHVYRGTRAAYEGAFPLERGALSSPGIYRRHDEDLFFKGQESPQHTHRSPSRHHPSPRKSYTGDDTPSTHGSRRNHFMSRSETARGLSTSPRRPYRLHTKIGVARDSLKIMSESGPPTSLERQLTIQMEIDLERFRKIRQKELSPVDAPPQPKPYPSLASGLTRGEVELQKGREANKLQRAREKAKRSFKEVTLQRPQGSAENPLPDYMEFTYRSDKDEDQPYTGRSHGGELPPLEGGHSKREGGLGAGEGPEEGQYPRDLRTLVDEPASEDRTQNHGDAANAVAESSDVRGRSEPDYAPAKVLDPQEDEGRSSDDDMDGSSDDGMDDDADDEVTSDEDDERESDESEKEDEDNDVKSNVPPSGTSSSDTQNVPAQSNRVDAASSPMKILNESPDTGIGVNGGSETAEKDTREQSGASNLSKEGKPGFYKSTTFITNSQRDVAT